jgi:hypothetical protein
VPVQLWASARGNEFVTPQSLPVKHEWHEDFTLCPPALAKAPGCADAPGFDRAASHKQFNADVVTFFRTHLVRAP